MFFSNYKRIQAKVSAVLITVMLVTSFAFTPMSPLSHVQTVQAHGPVTVIGGTGTVQETLSAGANTVVAGIQEAFFIKEFTLDGIFNGLAKMILKSMTQSILTWINSGFQGKPAFVTDLKQFMIDRADQVVGDFIYNDPALNFLCSPFQLDVKIALATAYQESQHEGFGSEAQCTLSSVSDNVEGFLSGSFSEGGWASWFEATQNPVNTPTGAYLAAEGEMYARIADDEGNTVNELEWGQGFLSFKVCSEAQKASGDVNNCSITTPGAVIADGINKALGAGQDALIEADEIDEIIGAFFAQLAKQAITGIYGLLGLGGGSFSDNSYGASGTNSYLDELRDENPTKGGGTSGNPFERSIKNEEANTVLQNLIIKLVNDSETALGQAASLHPTTCFNVKMPERLIDAREDALLEILISSSTVGILTALNEEYKTTDKPETQLEMVKQYNQMSSDGLIVQEIDNTKLELFIKNELTDMITALSTKVNSAVSSCNSGRSR